MAQCMHGRYAAIDIGTVTCRMLVADVCDGRVVPLAREYAITNLGEGVDASGVLRSSAMERVACAIDRYVEVRNAYDTPECPIAATLCVATSAARDAKNSDEFANMLKTRGLELAVIPGEQEAALSFRGATAEFAHVGRAGERVMVVDVGGGSTEVVTGRAGEAPCAAHSFDVGCRRMTERFLASDPPTADQIAAARLWCVEQFASYFAHEAGACGADRMIAVAGTATTAVSIREAMAVYDSDRVHGSVVTSSQLDEITQRLASLPLAQREQVVGLDPRRAPVITAGMIILEEVMRAAGMGAFTVSESAILQGMILQAADISPVPPGRTK